MVKFVHSELKLQSHVSSLKLVNDLIFILTSTVTLHSFDAWCKIFPGMESSIKCVFVVLPNPFHHVICPFPLLMLSSLSLLLDLIKIWSLWKLLSPNFSWTPSNALRLFCSQVSHKDALQILLNNNQRVYQAPQISQLEDQHPVENCLYERQEVSLMLKTPGK